MNSPPPSQARILWGKLPPRSLVVPVERAQFVNAKLSTKNEKAVEFSETLDLTPYTMWDQQSGTPRRTATYKLQGVVMHHGSKSTKTGHYAAYVRDRKQDSVWLHASDDTIITTTFTAFSARVRTSVSLLFYIREGHDDDGELRQPIADGELQKPISPRAASNAQTPTNGSVPVSYFAQPPEAPIAPGPPPTHATSLAKPSRTELPVDGAASDAAAASTLQLTEEQRMRIEWNRAIALQRRQAAASSPPTPDAQHISQSPTVTPGSRGSDAAKEENDADNEKADDSEAMEAENARPKRTHSEAITTPTSSSQGSPMKPVRFKHKTGDQQTHSLQGNQGIP
jgi:hypothetical protein